MLKLMLDPFQNLLSDSFCMIVFRSESYRLTVGDSLSTYASWSYMLTHRKWKFAACVPPNWPSCIHYNFLLGVMKDIVFVDNISPHRMYWPWSGHNSPIPLKLMELFDFW